ncbi:glycine--tRNA ligase subunit beta [Varunaivibrio sulfuroxidans]|uniref:Glycine--tRNA ligase beta subunit n=1 Tax=Varunaivibrio sulfuroxidans TaxID=1773489 RepID=A0A4R3J9I6_9PROT|nr:glycine--tRNA ligase subunit beta [Varunaivibrio sulfuroxidans]TCS62619.1 glycyl-tRNA synthetase beta chain [Varunaivibrio sulfuroxidans]WES30713.1 glycine--tRNA ligase subunit beta [Varunaivibrio sulfuroxidans]
MAELLFELLSEEIPARMQARAAAELKALIEDGLKSAELAFSRAEAFATPRRITVVIDGLPIKQPDVKEERKGPQTGAPQRAIDGFLKSLGGLTLDDCEQREIKGKTFYVAVLERRGRATVDVLGDILLDAVTALTWPKSMRWGTQEKRWVRPLHGVLALFDGAVVPLAYGGVDSGRETAGHRFLAPDSFSVDGFSDYEAKLTAAKVMLRPMERRASIFEQAQKLASEVGLSLRADDALLDEVTGLVEWPVVLMGDISPEYTALPDEVLIGSMRGHQKYFSLLNSDGALAAKFIVVANMETPDRGAAVIKGNERVLRARLSDAKFFWDQDRKTSLAARTTHLADIVFHAKLGNIDEKVDRVQALASELAGFIDGADKDRVRSAARLSKADLVTGMVGEFPELQGVMGRYYALHDGEHADVADAIRDHYAPLGPHDACPRAPVSVAVALADKIDTLVGFWTIDEKPTGSKDPYALRRAALGVIRLIVENGLRLPLLAVFERADGKDIASDLLAFFIDRLKVHMKGRAVRHDMIDAVLALGGEDDLVRLLARVDALQAFIGREDGVNLLTAYRRAANILKIEEKKDGRRYDANPEQALFTQDEERALLRALAAVRADSTPALRAERFEDAMSALAGLRAPVDAFFDKVTVNSDDAPVRENRLKLLSQIQSAMGEIADFSKLEG